MRFRWADYSGGMRDGGVTGPAIRGRILSCVEACDALVVVSEDCAEACLALCGDGVITACFIAALDCAEVCSLTSRMLSWHSSYDRPVATAILEACVEACLASTGACERMAALYDPWATCSVACRRVEVACTELLAVFELTAGGSL